MTNGLIIFCYCIAAYGLCNMVVFGSGPFKIFEWIRYLTNKISDHFGTMFTCMMCFPANVGLFCSLINWFFVDTPLTPFNIILSGTGLWWLAALCDCAFTSGTVWLIHHIEEYFELSVENKTNTVVTDEVSEDVIEAEDITLKK